MLKDYTFVSIQLILFALIAFWGNPHFNGTRMFVLLGLLVGIIGLVICVISLLKLNRNLSIFPTPLENGQLITSGLYAVVRHPIYLGVVLTGLGWGLFTLSIPRLVCSILLYILFYMKSGYEEKMLEQKFPEYRDYQKKTGRIIPWV